MNKTKELYVGKPWFNYTEEVMLLREQKKLTAAFFKSGIVLSARIVPIWNDSLISFEIKVPRTFSGKTRGLLGNLDGNITNDLHRRGQPIPTIPHPWTNDRDLLEPLMTCK